MLNQELLWMVSLLEYTVSEHKDNLKIQYLFSIPELIKFNNVFF